MPGFGHALIPPLMEQAKIERRLAKTQRVLARQSLDRAEKQASFNQNTIEILKPLVNAFNKGDATRPIKDSDGKPTGKHEINFSSAGLNKAFEELKDSVKGDKEGEAAMFRYLADRVHDPEAAEALAGASIAPSEEYDAGYQEQEMTDEERVFRDLSQPQRDAIAQEIQIPAGLAGFGTPGFDGTRGEYGTPDPLREVKNLAPPGPAGASAPSINNPAYQLELSSPKGAAEAADAPRKEEVQTDVESVKHLAAEQEQSTVGPSELASNLPSYLMRLPKVGASSKQGKIYQGNFPQLWYDLGNKLRMGKETLTKATIDEGDIIWKGKRLEMPPSIRQFLANPGGENFAYIGNIDAEKFGNFISDSGMKSVGTDAALSRLQARSQEETFEPLEVITIGSGIRKHKPLTMTKDGSLGRIKIDIPKLTNLLELHIINKATGKTVMHKKQIPLELLDILRKRTNKKQHYSPHVIELYRKIIELSKLDLIKSKSRKADLLVVNNPSDAVKRLEVLIGSSLAGNTSKTLRNDISKLADYLFKEGTASKEDHAEIHDKYIRR